jgi:hypothetical protein
MKAHVKNYGDVWYDANAITNILSLKNVPNKFHVTYDSNGEGAFIVHKPNGIDVHFVITPMDSTTTTQQPITNNGVNREARIRRVQQKTAQAS